MKINTSKRKVISSSPKNITIENESIEIVEELKFSGSVPPNLSLNVKRIAMANSTFGTPKKSARSFRDISTKFKLRLKQNNALIQPIAIHGSKT